MGVLSNEMGQGFMYGWLGNAASLSTTNTDINGNFVFNTSGTAYGIRFVSPVTQTSASLSVYLYLPSKTGSPTDTQLDIYPGPTGADDPQRPGTAGVLGTVTAVDLSGVTTPAWVTYTISSVSLTAGLTYWAVFSNNTGTPASNFPSFRNRGLNGFTGVRLTAWLTSTGFTTDPSSSGSTATEVPCVFAFSDGTLMGQPYVVSTNHANNANDRGVRFRFSAAMKFVGMQCSALTTLTTNIKVYQGSTLIDNVTLDINQKNNASTSVIYFNSVLTFSANTDYDIVLIFSGATTAFAKIDANAASSPPANVTNLTYTNQSYVDGTVPGSYTVTANSTGPIILIPDSLPASASGGAFNPFQRAVI